MSRQTPAEALLEQVGVYVNKPARLRTLGFECPVRVSHIAHGEYNINYLLDDGTRRLVLRVNTKSQVGLSNQIRYEYETLQLLGPSGVTPRACYLDDSKTELPYGLLAMEFLPGRSLDYHTDLKLAARTLARIHNLTFADEQVAHLNREPEPLTGIYRESLWMLDPYLRDPKGDPEIKRLMEFWGTCADERRANEQALQHDPWLRVVNTDLHNENFIVNCPIPGEGTCHLIDWEKPNYAEPAKDICHFLQVTTTRFKTDFAFTKDQEQWFLDLYKRELDPIEQLATFEDRLHIFGFFTLLRAIAWGCMVWSEYVADEGLKLKNSNTFRVVEEMIAPDYLRYLMRDKLGLRVP
jgi:aminoglycoside phosphotransferase (APT) family kinase protein